MVCAGAMRVQQVTVDVWKMLVTAASYLALAFAAWILLRLVCACITLPGYLKKQQQEEDAEEERLLLALQEEGDEKEDEDDDTDDQEGQDDDQEPQREVESEEVPEKGEEAEGGAFLTPPTPRASRIRRRLTKPAHGQDAGVDGDFAKLALCQNPEKEQLLPAGEQLASLPRSLLGAPDQDKPAASGEKKKRR